MKSVSDRIVQYPNRYQLVNVETGEVLGTYDFVEVTGTVQQAGTEIDKELFDSIQADLNTKADQDGTYTDLTAGKSNALTTAAMTASDDLNNFYGEEYWGKLFYCGGGDEPSHCPSGASGGSVFIYRNGTGSTVQEYTSNIARSGSNLPTKWIRARAYSGTWNAWEEIVTSTGDYANLSVGEATKATQDANGNVIDTTYATKTEANAKYTKPASGIPKTDLAEDVQASLEKADTAYQKPSNGIPESDLTETAQESLDKADTAYQKPSTGIPKTDLSEEVQTALETAVQGVPDATTTVKGIMTLGADGGAARYGNKSDVGLGNVDNVKQYSASNPPPYPVVANGSYPNMTVGDAEKLNGKAASEYALSTDIPDVSNFAEKTGTYSEMSVGNATNATNLIPDSNGAVNPNGRKDDVAVGNYSIALGYEANASDSYSSALGRRATASGWASIALGYQANASNSSSIAFGSDAIASGSSSIALGTNSDASGNGSIAIGAGATVTSAAPYTMQLGDDLSALRCKVNLTVTSDERDKTDIASITDALAFVERLTPVTFVSNDRVEYISDEDKKGETFRKYGMCEYDRIAHAAGTKKGERRRCGLLAQEVVAAMQTVYGTDNYANIVNDNFHDLQEKPSDVENKYTLAYANLVPFLIAAIKELNAKIKRLEDKLQ